MVMQLETRPASVDSPSSENPRRFDNARHYLGRGLLMAARITAPLMTAYISYRGYWGVINTMDSRLNSVLEATPAKTELREAVGSYCLWTLEYDDNIDLSTSEGFVSGFNAYPEVCRDMPHPDVIEAGAVYFQHEEYLNGTRPELFGAVVGVGVAGIAAIVGATWGAVEIGTDFPPREKN